MSENTTGKKYHGIFDQFPTITRKEWEEKVLEDLRGKNYDTLRWRPYEGFEIEPFYLRDDLQSLSYITDSVPGEYPYVRGIKTGDNDWDICEFISSANVKDANRSALKSIEYGAQAVTFQCIYDENRITGIPIQNIGDMEIMIDDIPLDRISVNFEPGIAGPEVLSLFISAAVNSGYSPEEIRGNLFYDPLRELSLTGRSSISFDTIYQGTKSLIDYTDTNLPGYMCLCVDSSEFHESGGNAVQEIAFTLSKGVDYLVHLADLGMDPEVVARNMVFNFPVSSSYFMEIAKFRTARTLWSKLVSEFISGDSVAAEMQIHARTNMWNKTVYDPYVNMLRGTVESVIAAVSGCSSFTVIPMNQTYETPNDFTRRMAANTQHIIKEESYLNRVIDPVAGSYYVENLTDLMIDDVFTLFLETEDNGGFTKSLSSGFIQDRISDTAEKKTKDLEKRKLIVLGTNQYPDNNEKMLKYVSDARNSSDIEFTGKEIDENISFEIETLTRNFKGKGLNVGDSVRSRQNDEIISVRKIERYRAAELFEKIRFATERYVGDDEKRRPAVFLFKFGNLASRNARASFAGNFFGCAGFAIIEDLGYDDIEQGIKACLDSRAEIVVLCSSDGQYPGVTPEICSQLKGGNPRVSIIIAGYPGEEIGKLKDSGVDDFIYMGCNAVNMLQKYQKILGITKLSDNNNET